MADRASAPSVDPAWARVPVGTLLALSTDMHPWRRLRVFLGTDPDGVAWSLVPDGDPDHPYMLGKLALYSILVEPTHG